MKSKFWHKKKVFITGASGFVGSSLAERLTQIGADVVSLVYNDSKKSYLRESGLDKKLTVVQGSIENEKVLKNIFNRFPVEVVFHLAAQPIVSLANKEPIPTFRTNILGTWNLLEVCRKSKHLKALIVASSDKAYGTHKKLPYREDYALQPEYPYDTSKACADLIAQSYHKTFGLPVVITRFANIYGPGDMNFSRIVPDTIRSVIQGKNPMIRSNGTPERDYLYVSDVADLYILLAENIRKASGEIFNAGHNHPVSVLEVVKTILELSGEKKLKPEILGKGSLYGEIDRQWMDGGKVLRMFGWKPKVDLRSGLRKTVDWYRAYLA